VTHNSLLPVSFFFFRFFYIPEALREHMGRLSEAKATFPNYHHKYLYNNTTTTIFMWIPNTRRVKRNNLLLQLQQWTQSLTKKMWQRWD